MSSLPSDGPSTVNAVDSAADTVELTVPDLGPEADRAVVVGWAKRPGDRVQVDEPICRLAVGELEFEVHSTADGELSRIYADDGMHVLERSSLAQVIVAGTPAAEEPHGPEPGSSLPVEPDVQGETPDGPPAARVETITPEPIDPEFAPAEPGEEDDGPPQRVETIEAEPIDPEFAPREPDAPDAAAPPRLETIEAGPIDPEFAPAELTPEPPAQSAEPEPAAPEPDPPSREPDPPSPEPDERSPEPEASATAERELPPAAAPPLAATAEVPTGDDVDWSGWISPVVQMLAEEHGIDLAEVRGTGVGGRIRKRDVLRHAESR